MLSVDALSLPMLLAADPQDALSSGTPQAILATIVGALTLVIVKVVHYHVTTVSKLEADHKAERDKIANDWRADRDAWLAKLEKNETERRQEAERLLREQKEIMREVMTTTQAIGGNLEENTKAMERLITMVERLGAGGGWSKP